jgi:phosphatidylserine decarboxylase
VRIDRAAWPFVLAAATPAAAAFWISPLAGAVCLALPTAIALFFRDPERRPPATPGAVLAPADGRVMFAGDARPDEAPAGAWLQVTIFLSLFDVHVNRTPVSGRVTRIERRAGTFLAAFRTASHGNTRTEISIDHGGTVVVFRQVVGVLARRIVCRLAPGDEVATGARIGLMKFGSRMDVFVPRASTLAVGRGDRVTAGESVIAWLPGAGR